MRTRILRLMNTLNGPLSAPQPANRSFADPSLLKRKPRKKTQLGKKGINIEREVRKGFVVDIDFSRLEGKEAVSPEIKGPSVEILSVAAR
jgi:hypothetical protein